MTWSWLLGVGVPSLILAIAAVVGAARERRARLDADPGPLRPLLRGWFSRLDIGSVRDRTAELRFRFGDRGRQDRTDRLERKARP